MIKRNAHHISAIFADIIDNKKVWERIRVLYLDQRMWKLLLKHYVDK